jgi:hypothetical protein
MAAKRDHGHDLSVADSSGDVDQRKPFHRALCEERHK